MKTHALVVIGERLDFDSSQVLVFDSEEQALDAAVEALVAAGIFRRRKDCPYGYLETKRDNEVHVMSKTEALSHYQRMFIGIAEYFHIFPIIDRVSKKPDTVSEDLNSDVSADQARALHRVVRAMHDGNCPNCGYLGPSYKFVNGQDHQCPACKFTITHEEACAALAQFQPFMKRNMEVFNEWRKQKVETGVISDRIKSV